MSVKGREKGESKMEEESINKKEMMKRQQILRDFVNNDVESPPFARSQFYKVRCPAKRAARNKEKRCGKSATSVCGVGPDFLSVDIFPFLVLF